MQADLTKCQRYLGEWLVTQTQMEEIRSTLRANRSADCSAECSCLQDEYEQWERAGYEDKQRFARSLLLNASKFYRDEISFLKKRNVTTLFLLGMQRVITVHAGPVFRKALLCGSKAQTPTV